ncbi:uroporphyrinogen-III C-methyltransferase [Halothiobacillus sp. DCM-1]|uniref:uroporphyrinogen-III C-methyltransferase n=1 Tax=Halothiobacillus sp. DCM-1 TaxID=3112558 RepID=UPI00324C7461
MSQKPEPETLIPDNPAETPADSPASGQGEQRPVPERRAYAYWLLTLFVVFSGSLISVSWYGWMLFQTNSSRIHDLLDGQQRQQTQLQQVQQEDHQALTALRAQIMENQSTEQTRLHALQDQAGQSQQRLSALETQLARLQDQLNRGTLAWQIEDINTLLAHAQEQLSIAHNPTSTAAALTLADQRLAALARPQVIPVRAAISEVLQQLQRADAFDAVGASLALRRAADTVNDWPLTGQAKAAEPAAPSTEPASDNAPWYVRWPRAAWQPVADWFSQQFILTREGTPFGQSARHQTDQEMRLWLTAVREAMMARDHRALTAALTQAIEWLDQHYDPHDATVLAAKTQLQAAADFYRHRAWPDLAPVFRAWQAAGLITPPTAPAAPITAPETQP